MGAALRLTTKHRFGPKNHGCAMSVDEFFRADYLEGHQYELIDGRLYVSPVPNPPENRVEGWLFSKVYGYSLVHPEVINYVTPRGRVFVPNRPGVTCPEPDLTAYHNYPLDLPFAELRWENLHPILVGEVLCLGDPKKDLVRNVELYHQVPSIKEYWLLDSRANPDRPTLTVRRRWGRKWRVFEFGYGDVYTTPLLPGFKLVVDPRR